LFAQLTDTQADRLLAGQIGLDVVAEQVLLLQQDEGEGLVVIQTGLAKVRAYTANGEEAVMAVVGPGDLMGEMAVLTAGVRNAYVLALTPLKVVKLRAGAYRELLLSDGSLSLALTRLLAARLKALNRRFLLRGGDASTRRLAALQDLALSCSRGEDPLAPAGAGDHGGPVAGDHLPHLHPAEGARHGKRRLAGDPDRRSAVSAQAGLAGLSGGLGWDAIPPSSQADASASSIGVSGSSVLLPLCW